MPINPTVTAAVTGLILQVGVQFRIKGGPSMNENYILIGVFFCRPFVLGFQFPTILCARHVQVFAN